MTEGLFDCPVCQTANISCDESQGAHLDCNHWLCWMCFAQLMRSNRSTDVRCPLCRRTDCPPPASEVPELGADDTTDPSMDETLVDGGEFSRHFFRARKITFQNCRVFFITN